jgi:hypothetical protein
VSLIVRTDTELAIDRAVAECRPSSRSSMLERSNSITPVVARSSIRIIPGPLRGARGSAGYRVRRGAFRRTVTFFLVTLLALVTASSTFALIRPRRRSKRRRFAFSLKRVSAEFPTLTK